MWRAGHWLPVFCMLTMIVQIDVASAGTPEWKSWLKARPDAAQLNVKWDKKTQVPSGIRGTMALVPENASTSEIVRQVAKEFSVLMGLGQNAVGSNSVEKWRGQTTYRFTQQFDGLPVEGHELVIGVQDNGEVSSLQNALIRFQGELAPRTIAPEQARTLALAEFPAGVVAPTEPVEVVLAHGKVPVRAYRVAVRGDRMWFVYVRADNGRVAWVRDAAIH
ncbi:MAG: hypothetical protein CMH54_03585 [Myxococcales bacterium]|nr:hypothetical protein [Myxococcales bacterium]